MANSQYPVDGKKGKAWKITSPFGWRIHPISKAKKHHNGTDIWAGSNPTWIESAFDGVVINAVRSTNPNGFGNSVTIQSKVMGKWITSIYAHMVDGSIKVKKGQKIIAGTPLGKMGDTGFATGKHLHWEIWDGKRSSQPNINSGGKGFYDPIKFVEAVIAWEKEQGNLNVESPDPDATPVVPAAPAAPAKPSLPAKPALSGWLKVGSKGKNVKWLQQRLGISADGIFGEKTRSAVMAFQKKHPGLKVDGIVGAMTWAKL